MELRREHGVSSDLEIPMEYFAYSVENALKIYGAHGEQNECITSQQWLEAIKLTGYIELDTLNLKSTWLWHIRGLTE
ncbi:hypothetical protein [Paenibacillus lemnae]|uniref:hypothetical protein n=1 Tax=Paenibacillus lemnae TaxID=1330551 RepID=UPI001469A169|nr:hypothetical protein [Paenibacillus lemnae]